MCVVPIVGRGALGHTERKVVGAVVEAVDGVDLVDVHVLLVAVTVHDETMLGLVLLISGTVPVQSPPSLKNFVTRVPTVCLTTLAVFLVGALGATGAMSSGAAGAVSSATGAAVGGGGASIRSTRGTEGVDELGLRRRLDDVGVFFFLCPFGLCPFGRERQKGKGTVDIVERG